jgi:hypothetical protein
MKTLDIWLEWSINGNEKNDYGAWNLRKLELKEGIER